VCCTMSKIVSMRRKWRTPPFFISGRNGDPAGKKEGRQCRAVLYRTPDHTDDAWGPSNRPWPMPYARPTAAVAAVSTRVTPPRRKTPQPKALGHSCRLSQPVPFLSVVGCVAVLRCVASESSAEHHILHMREMKEASNRRLLRHQQDTLMKRAGPGERLARHPVTQHGIFVCTPCGKPGHAAEDVWSPERGVSSGVRRTRGESRRAQRQLQRFRRFGLAGEASSFPMCALCSMLAVCTFHILSLHTNRWVARRHHNEYSVHGHGSGRGSRTAAKLTFLHRVAQSASVRNEFRKLRSLGAAAQSGPV
jgi:hypothetical protein